MPNRSMQAKFAKASVQRSAYAVDASFRDDYYHGLRDEMLPLDKAAEMVRDHIAKTQAQTALIRATREALGKRTSFPWSRR